MQILKTIKKSIPVLILSVLLISFFVGMRAPEAEAEDRSGWEQFGDAISGLFSTEDRGLTFTQFEGELAELTTDGYAEALVSTPDLRTFVLRIVNFALGFLGLFAVLMVIYGGVLYVASAGEEEKTQKGKKIITYSAVGILIVMGSFAFVNTIIRGAGEETTGQPRFIAGTTTAGGFNASAEEVSSLARDIAEMFILLIEVEEELKNIKNDAKSASLDYGEGGMVRAVRRTDVLGFLQSVKQKLFNIRTRFTIVDETYREINEKIRTIDIDIDAIRAYPEVMITTEEAKLKKDGEVLADCQLDLFEKGEIDCQRYPAGMYSKWKEIQSDIDTYIGDVMEKMKNDFEKKIDLNIARLEEINSELQILDATGISEIKTHYDSTISSFNTLKTELRAQKDLEELTPHLISALENELKYAEAISKLQTVQARLRANVVSGNAPLTVTFDVGGTMDPAGGSIIGANIDWDLRGTRELEGGDVNVPQEAVTCIDVSQDNTEIYGPTFRQCTYNHPGTYVASAKVKSNDPSKFLPGTSTLIIRVDPPTTLIDLDLTADGTTVPVMQYDEGGLLITNKDYVPVTMKEAERGIIFDATGTPNLRSCTWDFGDVRNIEVTESAQDCRQTVKFNRKGRYGIELLVTNMLGETAKKTFTIDVRDLAARIDVSPVEDIFIGDSVRIDGGGSSGDSIRTYEWRIMRERDREVISLGENANARAFNQRFQVPGIYIISLKVTSELGQSAEAERRIMIESRPPIAVFDYDIPRRSSPNTVHFNARGSFNPDGEEDDLIYQWRIRPETDGGKNWILMNDTNLLDDIAPVVKFREKGEYEVTLRVTDSRTIGPGMQQKYGDVTRNIRIDNVLDVSWDEAFPVTAQLNEEGEAQVRFGLISENATDYEIDFGDGEEFAGEMGVPINHTYKTAGTYQVEATVYDRDDNSNTISRRVYIGGTDSPLAHIGVSVNNAEVYDFTRPITVSRADILRFDASGSRNVDGTGRNLNYSWDFGDMNRSSSRIATHSYRELSPPDVGYYAVVLRVIDQNDPSKTDEREIYINVVNLPPRFSNVQGVPEFRVTGILRTPVNVNVRAFGAEDPDGQITQYRWWYFDVNRPDEPLGMQITTTPTATLKIGTRGREGERMTYGFGLEVTDNDNLKYSNEEDIMMGNYHTVTVVNGPNIPPTASFTVDRTTVFAGDPVNFTSTSTDQDGEIVRYYWDFDGDGFHNVEGTTQSNVSHVYTKRNMDGYGARLKVVDDGGAEAVSEPVMIYVDSHAEPPQAAFRVEPAEIREDERGFRVQFVNNSKADEAAGAEIIDYRWDFDLDYDSTGDGIPDNDIDSREENPARSFPGQGSYRVRLIVMDNQGNTAEAIQTVRVPLAAPPVADFTYDVRDGKIHFRNQSTSDVPAGAAIVRHTWDFDVDTPTTEDSTLQNPIHSYQRSGRYKVQLTVRDSHGTTDSIIKEVDFTLPEAPRPDEPVLPGTIQAVFTTTPPPANDGIVYLEGTSGTVTFDFTHSVGPITLYTFDKNILFDTTGDGIPDNDADFQTILPGRWTTNFEKAWGRIIVRLTVKDAQGNTHSKDQEIKFK